MERTFGMELEFADADKDKIILPKGYRWTDNELTRMINSDGTNVSHNGKFGGEINTRPYTRSKEDLKELKNFIEHLKECGANPIWNTGFDSHFYVKDLGIENIKKIFELSYFVAPYLKSIFDLPEWFENKYISPTPTYDYVEKINKAESIDDILNALKNSSHRGYFRFYINLAPLERLGTIEFRFFNTSFDFKQIKETIDFMYKFVDYAVTHNVEDFRQLNTEEKVISAFDINVDKIPKRTNPLLFAGEMTDFTTMLGKRERKNSKILTSIKKAVGNKHLQIVNSYWFDLEQAFIENPATVYTKCIYTFTCLEVIKNDYEFEWVGTMEFLNKYCGDKVGRLASLFYFEKIKAKADNKSEYAMSMWKQYVDKADEQIFNLREKTEKIIERLNRINLDYKIGDIREAIKEWDETKVIIYQNEFEQKLQSASNGLVKYSSIEGYEKYPTNYYNLPLENTKYVILSRHKALGLPKLMQDGRILIYSNISSDKNVFRTYRKIEVPKYHKLPNDYVITKNSKIKFVRAKANEIDYLRMMYLKKDILLGGGIFNYLWFIDDYLFGAMIFDYAKGNDTNSIVWLKSDFVIDSQVPKLSKLLIMAIKLKDFQKELNTKYKGICEQVTTNVFTNKPISMKYRGVFKLHKRDNGKLTYRAELGIYSTIKQMLTEFLQKQ